MNISLYRLSSYYRKALLHKNNITNTRRYTYCLERISVVQGRFASSISVHQTWLRMHRSIAKRNPFRIPTGDALFASATLSVFEFLIKQNLTATGVIKQKRRLSISPVPSLYSVGLVSLILSECQYSLLWFPWRLVLKKYKYNTPRNI